MGEEFILDIISILNEKASKKRIKDGLKGMDNSMYVKVISKLSMALSKRQLKKDLKQLNDLYLQIGADLKIDNNLKKKLEDRIKTLQNGISDLQIDVSAKSSDITKTVTEIRNKGQRQADKAAIDFNIEVKKEKAIADLEYIAKKYSKLFSNASASQKYSNIFDAAQGITNSKELSNVRAQIAAFTSELKANGLATQSLGDRWKNLVTKCKDLFSAATLIRIAFTQARQAISTTLDLDKVYTDLIKVNNELNRNDYADYLSRINQKAKELATTQKGIIEGATEFSKSGFNLSTSNKLSEISTILANVGEMSDSDSAKAIISGVQAYDVIDGYDDVIDKANALIDKYNEIGNTASITTAEIAQGVQKVGSVFADANTSVDEFIALLSAGNRQFQDADNLSLALRTAALRIRGCSAELETMGEETDGVYTSTAKLAEKIEGLTNINGTGGVKILQNDEETFRSIYEIFLDISKVYKDMSDTDASALLELIAGKNRASAISATLNNMSEAEEILQNSINAAGSAQKEYNAYLESTEAHIAKFKATLVETYSTFMNGDMISYTADMGTAILDLVNSTDLLRHGILAVLSLNIGKGITSVGASIASTVKQMNTLGNALQQIKNLPVDDILKRKALDEIGESTKNLTESNLKLLLSQKNLEEQDKIAILRKHDLSEEDAKLKLQKLGLLTVTQQQTVANVAEAATTSTLRNAMLSLKASVIGVGASIKAAFLSNPIGITLMGITTAISIGTTLINRHNKKLEEARQAMQEAKQEYEDLTSEVADLNEEFETARERLKELDAIGYNNLSLVEQEEYDRLKATNDELERELRIKEALAKVKEKEVADNARESLENKSEGSIENYTYGVERERVDKIDSINEYLNLAEKQKQSLEEAKQALEDYENAYSGTSEEMVQDKSWQKLNDNVEKAEQAISDTERTISEKYGSIEEDAEGLVDSFGNVVFGCEAMYKRVQELMNRIDAYFNPGKEEQDQTETADSGIENTANDMETLFAQLIEGKDTLDKFQSSVKSASDAYATLLSGNYSTSELLSSIQTINKAVSDMGGSLNWEFINSQTDSLDLLGDAIQHVSQKYAESVLSGAGIDVNSAFGQMLADMIQKTFEAEAAFAGMNSQLDNLQSSYQTLTGILESYNKTGYISLDNLQSLLTADENLIAMLEVENGQLVLNQEAYENLVAVQLMEFKAKLNDAAAAEIEMLAKQKAEEATNKNADASNNAVEKLDAETAAFNRNTSAAIANAVAKAEESGVSEEDIQGIFDKYDEVWDAAVSNFGGDFDGFMGVQASKAGKKAGDAYVDAFEKELKKLQTLRDQGKITEKQYLDYLRKLYQKFFKDKKKYAEEYEKYEHEYLQGMKSLYGSALSGITSILDKQISAYGDARDAAVESLGQQRDAVIEAKEAEKERYEQEIDLIDKQIAAKNKIIDGIQDEIDAMREANEQKDRENKLAKAKYDLERMMNQHSILQYSGDKGFSYVQDLSGARDKKQAVEDAELEIEIANKEKEIKLIEKEIGLLEERKSGINDQVDLLDKEIGQINGYYDKLISDTEKYWDNLIKGMEDYKSRWEELAEIEEQAKVVETLRALGIETGDILGMSEEAFAKFKDDYIGILADIYSGNDSMLSALSDTTGRSVDEMGSYLDATQGYIDSLSGIGESLSPVAEAVSNVDGSMGSLSSTTSEANGNLADTVSMTGDVATNVSGITTNLTEANTLVSEGQAAFSNLKQIIDEVIEAISQKTQAIEAEQNAVGTATGSEMSNFELLKNKILEVKETLDTVNGTVTTMDRQPIDNLTNAFQLLYDQIVLVSNELSVNVENSIASAIQVLNNISLEEGIIAQFTNLKTAIDSVTSAISGGGGESSGGEGKSGSSGSKQSGESGGKSFKGESGGGNSLTGAITEMGNTAKEIIGEPDAEGDGTVIGEFGSMETAVNDVRDAIGTEGSGDGEGGNSGGESDDTLVGSIEYLGDKTDEEMGESGGDGIIGRFEEFEGIIEEAANQVRSISEGLEAIDGQEVECTITVNVKMNGSIPAFASGTVLGNMQIESATYNAQYGKAFASGTIGLPHAEKNALVSEYGQTEMTVLPDGKTIITDTPTMMDLPKDTVIYNEDETKKIMDNKIDVSGSAHADGTGNNVESPVSAKQLTFLNEWDRMEKLAEALGRSVEDLMLPLNSIALDIKKETGMGRLLESVNNVNNVTNNTKNQPVTVNQNVTLSCPNLTNNSGVEYVQKELGHLSLKATQMPLNKNW